MASLLSLRNIPARVVHGMPLGDSRASIALKPYLQIHNETAWITIDVDTAAEGLPDDFFLWSRAQKALLKVENDPHPELDFAVQRNPADALAVAKSRTNIRDERMISYSLLALPTDRQEVFRVLLTVPIGAFVMLVLRNIVGLRSFGTFMPVLIALAFRETKLLAGIVLFTIVIALGLLVRFYLERLRLLLVPRLTAVLIVVVLLMCGVAVVSNRLHHFEGISVALFPMVIMAMTIERLSIAWDERGASHALRDGLGSLMVAVLAYLIMSWKPLENLIFVFPELLLVVLALTLLIGRYSGYRLTELTRFKALATPEAGG
jgi:7 transmembrane helices usually fused to an inactive transglutaminase